MSTVSSSISFIGVVVCGALLLGVVNTPSPMVIYADAFSSEEFFSTKTQFYANDDNPCSAHWTSPNLSNDFSCPSEMSEYSEYVFTHGIHWRLLPLIIGLIVFIPCSCCILSFRYCCQCCGGSKMRPGGYCCPGDEKFNKMKHADIIDTHYSCLETCFVKNLTLIPMLLGFLSIWFCVHGAMDLTDGFDKTVTAVDEGWEFFINLGEYTFGNITRDANNQSDLPPGIDVSIIEDYISDMKELKKSTLDQTTDIRTMLVHYAVYPGYIVAVPAALMIFPLLSALCNLRKCLPFLVIIISFILQFAYLSLGTATMLLLVPIDLACDEVNATYDPSVRGIVNWYAVPRCEDQLPFQSLIDEVLRLENETSQRVCEELLNVCDTSSLWSFSSDPQKVFQCNVTSGYQCQNFETVVGTVTAMRLKPIITTFTFEGFFFETCGGYTENCTLRQCAMTCDRDEVRTTSATAVRILDALVRVKYALTTILFPWLNCTKIFAKLADSGPVQACSALLTGVDNMKNGFMVAGVALLFNTWVCFLGQKRFACPTAYWRKKYYGEDHEEEEGGSNDGEDAVEMDSVLQPHEDDLKQITSVGTEGGISTTNTDGGGAAETTSALLLYPGSPHFPDGGEGGGGGAAVAVAEEQEDDGGEEEEGGENHNSRRASILVASPSMNPFATYITPAPTPVQSPGIPRPGGIALSLSNRQLSAYHSNEGDNDHSSQEDDEEELGSGQNTPPENTYVRPRSSIVTSNGRNGPLQLVIPADRPISSSRQGGGSVVNTPYHTPYHMDPVYASRSAFVNMADMNEQQ